MILESIWFLLPAFGAVVIPLYVRKINFLNIPIDFNIKYKNKPLFGKNKTFRGFFFGIIAATIICYFQYLFYFNFIFIRKISIINYFNYLLIGFLFGFGALCGDLIKSFFKRRMNIASGKPWIPFDEMDYVLGSLILINIFYRIELAYNIVIFFIGTLFHYLAVKFAYAIGLRKS